eukprot:COSAG01_NODE_71641_length_255_cov_0.666667_1_plen_55_part_01
MPVGTYLLQCGRDGLGLAARELLRFEAAHQAVCVERCGASYCAADAAPVQSVAAP